MLNKQETGLAGQETEHKRTSHKLYSTVIQQVPVTVSDTENTTINRIIYNILNTMFIIQESGFAEQEKKNKRKTPTNVYPKVQRINHYLYTNLRLILSLLNLK